MSVSQTAIIGTVFQWGALAGVFYAAWRVYRYASLGGWRPLAAKVVRSEVVEERDGGPGTGTYAMFVAKIEYEYELNGKTYRATVIDGGGDLWTSARGRADGLCAKYPEGSVVEAFVNPDDFSQAYLERSKRAIVIGLAGTALVWGLGTFLKGL